MRVLTIESDFFKIYKFYQSDTEKTLLAGIVGTRKIINKYKLREISMKKKSFVSLNFYLAILAALLLSACDNSSDKNNTEKVVRPAKLITVGQAGAEDFLRYPAVIKSLQLRKLSFAVSGVVQEVTVVESQAVKKGEVLARLDQRDLQAQLNSASAQYKNADEEYQRAVRLMEQDAISRSDLQQRKSARDVNKAGLATAEKALQDSVLIAPYDGNISLVSIKTQQNIQAGTVAIDILGSGGLEATINLPSSIIAKSGSQEETENSSYIILDAVPDHRIPATFKEIVLEADTASQTYALTFTFVAPKGVVVLPGMNATVWFKDPSKPATDAIKISIPLTAVATESDKKYVWVVDSKTMTVAKRTVVIDADVGTMVNVINGLSSGETIVAAGVSVLSEGMEVSRWSK